MLSHTLPYPYLRDVNCV